MFCSLPSVMLKELADKEGNISVNLEKFCVLRWKFVIYSVLLYFESFQKASRFIFEELLAD